MLLNNGNNNASDEYNQKNASRPTSQDISDDDYVFCVLQQSELSEPSSTFISFREM